MSNYNMFKKTLNGFDKDAVLSYIEKQDERYGSKIAELEKQVAMQKKTISGLTKKLVRKDNQLEHLQSDIETKYQHYIDNYQQIGELVYESKIKSEEIIAEARGEADQIIAEAESAAERRMALADIDIDSKIEESQKRYHEIREEIDDIVDMFHQMQQNFVDSYKKVHVIIDQLPDSMNDLKMKFDDDADDEPEFNDLNGHFAEDLDLALDPEESDEDSPIEEEEEAAEVKAEEPALVQENEDKADKEEAEN